ncbi:hypothetical protein PVAP13_9NG580214 [Panicum virgatum]|uniref:Uncharacterized protein n=1 Tax=Panicum virgatum TaxID=38727 RepID=A0A8T0MX64_PANVG|nr:hypothetical protein PVAP13_9NG580214 [Panicum virgatum]
MFFLWNFDSDVRNCRATPLPSSSSPLPSSPEMARHLFSTRPPIHPLLSITLHSAIPHHLRSAPPRPAPPPQPPTHRFPHVVPRFPLAVAATSRSVRKEGREGLVRR